MELAFATVSSYRVCLVLGGIMKSPGPSLGFLVAQWKMQYKRMWSLCVITDGEGAPCVIILYAAMHESVVGQTGFRVPLVLRLRPLDRR